MKSAPIPPNESERLEALYSYKLLDTPPETVFDDLTQLAAQICEAPISTITLIDSEREWYKSRVGINDQQAERIISFCAHTILEDDLLIVSDTLKDERFFDNPFVTDEPPLRFYAGVPLKTYDGHSIGTLCVIDNVPRNLNSNQINALKTLAQYVVMQIEVRHTMQEISENINNPAQVFKSSITALRHWGENINQNIKLLHEHILQLRDEITRRKQADANLKEEKSLTESIINSSMDGILAFDKEYRYTIWNSGMEKISGIKKEDVLGKCAFDVFPFLKEIGEEKYFYESIKGKNIVAQDRPYEVPETGKKGFFKGHYSPHRDESGNIIGGLAIIHDITERKKMENTHEELRKCYEMILNSAGEGIYGLDLQGCTTFINPAAEKMIGWKKEDLIGLKQHDILHHTKVDGSPYLAQDCPIYAALKDGKVHTITDEVFWRKDGTSFPVEYTSTPIMDVDSKPNGAVVVFKDISIRKQVEKDLRFTQFAVEKADDCIYWIRPDASFFYVNSAACNSLGYSREELLSMHVYEIDPLVNKETWFEHWEIIKHQKYLNIESQHRTRDGRLLDIEVKANYLQFEGGEYDCAIVRDITKRKLAEKQLTAEKKILAMIASDDNLIKILDVINIEYENLIKNSLCTIWLMEENGEYLSMASAPNIPLEYSKLVNRVKIGPDTGSCATAVYRKERVIVSDIENDPLWKDFRDIALKNGLRSCWSTPIRTASDNILGTFAVYSNSSCNPTNNEIEIIDRMIHLAGIAIERFIAKQVLTKSETKYRSIVETTKEWIWEFDTKCKHTYSNNTVKDILGYEVNEILKLDPYLLMHEEDRNNIKQLVEKKIKEKKGWQGLIVRWRHKNGEYRYLESNAIPVFDKMGEIICYRGSDRDITERKSVEKALIESENKFSAAFLSSPDSVSITSIETGRIIDVNKSFEKFSGYSRNEIIGKTTLDLKVWHDINDRDEIIKILNRDGSVYNFETKLKMHNGEIRTCQVSSSIFNLNDEKCAISIIHDITEKKQVEVTLNRTNRALTVLGKCNDVIVHAKKEITLLDEICKILVECSNYKLATIAYAQNDTEKSMKVMVGIGQGSNYLTDIKVTWGEDELGCGPWGTTVKTGIPYVSNVLQKDPHFAPWVKKAASYGFKAEITFPLKSQGTVIGVLAIYSNEIDAFDEIEVKLLKDMAENLAFGITSIRIREKDLLNENLLKLEKKILSTVTVNKSLSAVMDILNKGVEKLIPGAISSVLLFEPENSCLRHCSAPSLPDEYNRAIDGYATGPTQGSCGTAVYRKERVIVSDIANNPLWKDVRHIGLKYGLKACWSTPIMDKNQNVLGTFALYYREIRHPSDEELHLIDRATALTVVTINYFRTQSALYESEERYRLLYENNPSMYLTLNVDGIILSINEHGAESLGWSAHDLIGRNINETLFEADKSKAKKLFENCLRNPGKMLEIELRKVQRNGEIIWVKETARSILDTNENQVVLIVCRDITERKKVDEMILNSRERLRNLTSRLQSVREKERTEISREIHDEFGQQFAAIKIQYDWLINKLPDLNSELKNQADKIGELLQDEIEKVREFSTRLRPPVLDEFGLDFAIKAAINDYRKIAPNIKFRCSAKPFEIKQNNFINTAVFRVYQEAMTNAIQHARPSQIKVKLWTTKTKLKLQIEDNGCGITEDSINSLKSLGIIGMFERVGELHGNLEINAKKEGGTVILMDIPHNLSII